MRQKPQIAAGRRWWCAAEGSSEYAPLPFCVKRVDPSPSSSKSSIACAAFGKAGGFLALDWCDGGPVSSVASTSFDLHRSLADELDGARSYGYRCVTTLSMTVTGVRRGQLRPSEKPAGVGWRCGGGWADDRDAGDDGAIASADVHEVPDEASSGEARGEVGGGKGEETGRVEAVVSQGGRVIEAESVVLALGPRSSKMAILSLLFRGYGLKAHSIMLEPKEPDAITPHALFLSYCPAHGP